jgi:hypothetical protein
LNPARQVGDRVVRDRHLDLWQTCTDRKPAEQFAECFDQAVYRLRQYLAAMHVSNERRMPFAKTHEYPALARNVLDGQTGTAPVIPCRARERLEPALRLHIANALEIVAQGPGLDLSLLFFADMLQSTATTTTENFAACRHSLGRRLDDVEQFRFVEFAPRFAAHVAHFFAHKRTGYEHLLAARVGDAATVMRDCRDRRSFRLAPSSWHGLGPGAQEFVEMRLIHCLQRVTHQRKLTLDAGGIKIAAHELETKVNEPGIQDISLAVVTYLADASV